MSETQASDSNYAASTLLVEASSDRSPGIERVEMESLEPLDDERGPQNTEPGDSASGDGTRVPVIQTDGGWGWVVCFTSMVANGIVNATISTFGILYVEMVKQFAGDDPVKAFKTSWVGSVAIGLTFLMCPVAGVASDRFGLRRVSVAGGLLAFVGMFSSAFVNDLKLLYLTYGVCIGVGFAFPFTTSVVILGHYFKKRLGLVNGIATFGSSAFSLTYSLAIPALVTSAGLKYTLLFLSGVHFLIIPCALTWKPRIPSTPEKAIPDSDVTRNKDVKRNPHVIDDQISANGGTDVVKSKSIGRQDRLKISAGTSVGPELSAGGHKPGDEKAVQNTTGTEEVRISEPSNRTIENHATLQDALHNSENHCIKKEPGCDHEVAQKYLARHKSTTHSADKERDFRNTATQPDAKVKSDRNPPFVQEVLGGIEEARESLLTETEATGSAEGAGSDVRCCGGQRTCGFVNVKLWSNRGFVAWTVGTSVAYLGFLVPFFHLVRHSNDLYPDSNSNLLPLCSALTIGASRLLIGPIADTKRVRPVRVQQAALLSLGISTICIPVARSFEGLVAISLVLGVCEGVFFLLNGPIVFGLVGEKDASQALGFFLGMIALPISVGSPLAGLMYDHFGSYRIAFHVAGITPIAGALIMMLMPHRQDAARRQGWCCVKAKQKNQASMV